VLLAAVRRAGQAKPFVLTHNCLAAAFQEMNERDLSHNAPGFAIDDARM
jgi:hypothetical protein